MDERVLRLKDLWFTYSITDKCFGENFVFYGDSDKENLPKLETQYFTKEMIIEFSSAGVLFITADVDVYEKPPYYNEHDFFEKPLTEKNIMTSFIENHDVNLDCISEKTLKKTFKRSGNFLVGDKDCIKDGFRSMVVLDIKEGYYKHKKRIDLFFQKTNVLLNISATIKEEEEGGEEENE